MKKEIEIELSPEIAEGLYSNLTVVSHSPSDFVVDFVRLMPGVPKSPVKARIILSPMQAKQFLATLSDNIRQYESQFGTIRIPEGGGSQIPPFMIPGGEA